MPVVILNCTKNSMIPLSLFFRSIIICSHKNCQTWCGGVSKFIKNPHLVSFLEIHSKIYQIFNLSPSWCYPSFTCNYFSSLLSQQGKNWAIKMQSKTNNNKYWVISNCSYFGKPSRISFKSSGFNW